MDNAAAGDRFLASELAVLDREGNIILVGSGLRGRMRQAISRSSVLV
jgi:hypothetical protein